MRNISRGVNSKSRKVHITREKSACIIDASSRSRHVIRMKKGVIIGVVGVCFVLFWWLAIRYFSLENIQYAAKTATAFTDEHKTWVVVGLILGNTVGMIFALPTKAVFTLLAGALLGPFIGSLITEIGVISGTTILFFVARHLFRDVFSRKLGELGSRMEARLTGRPIRALIGLRLFITLPYGPITLAAALSRMSYREFLIGTLIGDVPVVIAYSIAAHRLFMLTSLNDALSPWTVGILVAIGLFIFLTAILGKRQEKLVS